MADVTLVMRVPADLQDTIIEIVDKIISIPRKKENSGESYAEHSLTEINNNTLSLNAINATSNVKEEREESKEPEKEIVKEKEQEKRDQKEEPWPPPYETVKAYIANRRSSISASRFYEWMQKHNWIDGTGCEVRDWRAKIESWEKRNLEKPQIAKPAIAQQEPRKQTVIDDSEHTLKLLESLASKNGGKTE